MQTYIYVCMCVHTYVCSQSLLSFIRKSHYTLCLLFVLNKIQQVEEVNREVCENVGSAWIIVAFCAVF